MMSSCSQPPLHLLCVLEGGTLPSSYNSTPGHGSSKLNLRPIIQVGSLSTQAPLATGPSEWMRGLPLGQSDHPCQMPLASPLNLPLHSLRCLLKLGGIKSQGPASLVSWNVALAGKFHEQL